MKGAHMAAPRLALLVCVVSTTLSGCVSMASLQDWQYTHTNKARASEAWVENYTHDQRAGLGCDYEDGFKTGFVDTATGKDCRVPPVPPPKYWSAKYQCCEGQTFIQDWFRGYQSGIVAAESRGFPGFHEVPVSAQAPVVNRTACGKCYAGDRCQCAEPAPAVLVPHHVTQSSAPASPAAAVEPENYILPASVGLIGPADLSAMPASFNAR